MLYPKSYCCKLCGIKTKSLLWKYEPLWLTLWWCVSTFIRLLSRLKTGWNQPATENPISRFTRRSKKTSKVRVTGLCEGNSPVTGEFPEQRASNAENVSIWLRHHVDNTLVSPNKSAESSKLNRILQNEYTIPGRAIWNYTRRGGTQLFLNISS